MIGVPRKIKNRTRREKGKVQTPVHVILEFEPKIWCHGGHFKEQLVLDKKISQGKKKSSSSQNQNTYHNLKPVQKGWRISKAPIFSVGWIIFGYISISSCAQENLLDATVEGITQILHWIHHHPAIYDITCEQCTQFTFYYIGKFSTVLRLS